MRYKMSADTSEKEKIVGGVLTLNQTLWLGVGFVITVGVFVGLASIISPAIAIVIALPPGMAIAFPFAFYKKEGLPLAEFLKLNHKFKQKSKILVNTLTYGKTGFSEDVNNS